MLFAFRVGSALRLEFGLRLGLGDRLIAITMAIRTGIRLGVAVRIAARIRMRQDYEYVPVVELVTGVGIPDLIWVRIWVWLAIRIRAKIRSSRHRNARRLGRGKGLGYRPD